MPLDYTLLLQADAAYVEPWCCFGLETKATYILSKDAGEAAAFKSYYRPPSEPILWSFWPELSHLPMQPERALEMVSLLTGKKQSFRTKPIFGFDEHGRKFRFAPPPGRAWLEDMPHDREVIQSPEAALTDIFLNAIYAHPFTDGNGRFARALLLGFLAQCGLLTSPCLPLSSVFHSRSKEIGAAVRLAVTSGKTMILQATLCGAVNRAAQISTYAAGHASAWPNAAPQ